MSSAQPTQTSGPGRGTRLAIIGVLGVVAAALVTIFLVWFVFFSSEAPEAPTIDEAAAVLGASPAPVEASGAPVDVTAGAADGAWNVDTSIGDISDGTSSYVGFRVAEVLARVGETEAIGRTPAVSGELVVSGTTLESALIEADLTQIRSDRSRRDRAIQRALETGEFPRASFASSAPVDLGSIPTQAQTVTASVPGVLTIHGVSRDVVAAMEARLVEDVVVVVGTVPVDFTSFGITMPTAPVVVSVQDSGDLEWQLFFRRAGEPS